MAGSGFYGGVVGNGAVSRRWWKKFHVKHQPRHFTVVVSRESRWHGTPNVSRESFPDTELGKYYVEQVFNVDGPHDAAKRMPCQP